LQKEVKEVGIYSRLLPILLESLPELFELPEEVIASLEKSVENHERKFQASEASVGGVSLLLPHFPSTNVSTFSPISRPERHRKGRQERSSTIRWRS
jgi:hypothetical protein